MENHVHRETSLLKMYNISVTKKTKHDCNDSLVFDMTTHKYYGSNNLLYARLFNKSAHTLFRSKGTLVCPTLSHSVFDVNFFLSTIEK